MNRLIKPRHPLVISLDWTRPKDPPLSLGHASLISNLNKNNIDYKQKSWSVNHSEFNSKEVIDFILMNSQKNTDVALGAFVWNEKYIQEIIKGLRNYKFDGKIIIGGPQISYLSDNKEIDKFYNGDIYIRGTAEEALVKLYDNNQQTINEKLPVKGVYYRGIPSLGGAASASLTSLESPFLSGLIPPQPFIRWETQRGCPFSCSFCQHKEVEKESKKQNRFFDKERVFLEVDWILKNPIIKDIAVLDPVFNSGGNYIKILESLRLGGYKGRISLQAKADMVTEEFITEIKKFNQAGAEVILEFGIQTSNKNEQKLINRGNNMKKIEKIFHELNYYNINYEASLIFGLPMQTLSSFKESVKFCEDLKVPTIHAFPLMLLRGTQLYYKKKEYNYLESNEINVENIDRIQQDIPHVVSSNSFSYEEWKDMAEIASNLELRNKRMKLQI